MTALTLTVAATAHATGDPGGREPVLIVVTRVRRSLVGVMEQPEARCPALQRHLERLDREMAIVDGADGPADDEPGKQVQDHREVRLALLTDAELARVTDPPLIRSLR